MKLYFSLVVLVYSWIAQGLAYFIDAQHQDARPVFDTYAEGLTGGPLPSEVGPLRPRQDLDTRAAAKAAIDAMNTKFYSSTDAIWSPSDAWWLSGVAITTIMDYMRKTGSKDYMNQVKNIIKKQRTQ